MSLSPSFYDPYNEVSYVEINKRRRGDYYERRHSQKLENRSGKPPVRRLYVKRNGEENKKKPKLFVWRIWQSPTLANLLEDVGPYVGLDDGAVAIYDSRGNRIMNEDDIIDNNTYYVTGHEELLIPYSEDGHRSPERYNRDVYSRRDSDISRNYDDGYGSRGSRQSYRGRHTALSAPEYPNSRHTLYDSDDSPSSPPRLHTTGTLNERDYRDFHDLPITYTSQYSRMSIIPQSFNRKATKLQKRVTIKRRRKSILPEKVMNVSQEGTIVPKTSETQKLNEYERYYLDAIASMSRQSLQNPNLLKPNFVTVNMGRKVKLKNTIMPSDTVEDLPSKYTPQKLRRSRSTSDYNSLTDDHLSSSDFHDVDAAEKDRQAIEKHRREKVQNARRRYSQVIYNRKDQTHPEAYIIYVFLNGQGMECQVMNFNRKQLEKGINYVLELIARKFSVNPGKLCDMDGRKMSEVPDLMSRGSYILVPVGQSFRDTCSNQRKIDERSAQRDRLIQKREKKLIKGRNGLTYTASGQRPSAQKRSQSEDRYRTPSTTTNYRSYNTNSAYTTKSYY